MRFFSAGKPDSSEALSLAMSCYSKLKKNEQSLNDFCPSSHTLAVHQCNDRIIQPLQFHVLSNLFGLLRSFPVRLWLCDMSVVNWKTKGMQLSFMRTNSVKFIESNPVRMASISLRHILNTWWSSIIMLNSPCLTLHSKKFIGKASLSHQEMDIIPDL